VRPAAISGTLLALSGLFFRALPVLVTAAVAAAAAVGWSSAATRVHACEWRRVTVSSPLEGQLHAVAAASATDAWAIGGDYVLRWRGDQWNLVPVPGVSSVRYADVASLRGGSAWIVGSSGRSALIERWTGRAWLRVALPAPVARAQGVGKRGSRELVAVSANARDDVWAVGNDWREDTASDLIRPFGFGVILHWDGVAWRRVRIPGEPLREVSLTEVIAGPSGVWVFGRGFGSRGLDGLAARWDGKRWRTFKLRRPATSQGPGKVDPQAAIARGTNRVLVVGHADTFAPHSTGETWGLLYEWNGRRWNRRVPDFRGSYASYDAVAVSGGETWIAKNDTDAFNPQDGTQLFTAQHPDERRQLGEGEVIESLASDSRGIWAVGWIGTGQRDENSLDYADFRPLIERYGC
jgi:hypothetical protein